jgi:hypothetical protein
LYFVTWFQSKSGKLLQRVELNQVVRQLLEEDEQVLVDPPPLPCIMRNNQDGYTARKLE